MHLHFDCASGVAGDMLLASLLSLGADLESLRIKMQALALGPHRLDTEQVQRAGIAATYLSVIDETTPAQEGSHHHHGDHHHEGPHRHLKDMLSLADQFDAPETVRNQARAVFTLLAEAEATVHGSTPQKVHFHEVSGIDTAIDVLGVCWALDALGVQSCSASTVAVGGGTVRCAHGTLPVPAPATSEILRRYAIPFHGGPVEKELCTPTGAALLAVLCTSYGAQPASVLQGIGYGAGTADFPGQPNIVRALLGDPVAGEVCADQVQSDTVRQFVAVIDDCTGEGLADCLASCLAAGAVDAYAVPAMMKKGRPGHEITVLAHTDKAAAVEAILFRQSGTIGMRVQDVARRILPREEHSVDVDGHAVRVKVASFAGDVVCRKAEYEDCHTVAKQTGRSLAEVRRLAEDSSRA